jgi:hypothetical protein
VTDDERVPLADVLGDLNIHPLPEGWITLDAFLVINALDEEGQAAWSYRTTSAPNQEELLGALNVQCDLLRRKISAQFEEEEQ